MSLDVRMPGLYVLDRRGSVDIAVVTEVDDGYLTKVVHLDQRAAERFWEQLGERLDVAPNQALEHREELARLRLVAAKLKHTEEANELLLDRMARLESEADLISLGLAQLPRRTYDALYDMLYEREIPGDGMVEKVAHLIREWRAGGGE